MHLTESGLFVYKADEKRAEYEFLDRNADFGKSDLVFTGNQGLTVLSFDSMTNSWWTLIDPKHMSNS